MRTMRMKWLASVLAWFLLLNSCFAGSIPAVSGVAGVMVAFAESEVPAETQQPVSPEPQQDPDAGKAPEETQAPADGTEAPTETQAPAEAPDETAEAPAETQAPADGIEAPAETQAPAEAPDETAEVPAETQAPADTQPVVTDATTSPDPAQENAPEDVLAPKDVLVKVSKVTVSPPSFKLDVGQKLQLNASVEPANASNQALKWATSNKKIATVDQSGLVTAVKPGKAKITATAQDGSKKAGSCTITVAVLAKGIAITGATALYAGGKATLKANVTPSNTTSKSVSWASGDPSVATVSSKGVVTAQKVTAKKTVTITATTKDGSNLTASYVITVTPVAGGVLILKNGAPTSAVSVDLAADPKVQLTAKVSPDDANQAVSWATSDKKIAKVDQNGLVTALKAGKVKITATAKDGSKKAASCTMTVASLAKGITITGATALYAGGKATLKANVTPSNTTSKSVNWASGDTAVATVDNKGVVTAQKVTAKKTVTITATTKDGSNLTASYVITVTPVAGGVLILKNGAPTSAVSVDLAADPKVQLTAKVSPDDANQAVSWATSDKKIATVDQNGLVTALKAGKVKITATAKDGSKKAASCTMTVASLAKGIAITGATALYAGGKATLKANVTPSNTTSKSVSWVSGDTAVATVDGSGVVTAQKIAAKKTVTITATTKDGSNLTASYVITVTPVAGGVLILKNGAPTSAVSVDLAADPKVQLAAKVSPDDANQAVSWATSDKKIATVDQNGLVTALKAGKVKITATAKDGSKKAASCTVTVASLAKTIAITGATALYAGGKATLKATVNPSGTTNKSVNWASGDTAVATVDGSGVVTAQKVTAKKTVTITATTKDGSNLTASYVITVTPVAGGVTILMDNQPASEAVIFLGEDTVTLELGARVAPADADQAVSWSSSGSKIAAVSANGVVTGVKAGAAIITATAKDGSGKKNTIKITVKNGEAPVPLSLDSVAASGDRSYTGEAITWTAAASGGVSPYTYRFDVYKEDQLVRAGAFGAALTASYTPTAPGSYHVVAYVRDASQNEESLTGDPVTVIARAGISAVTANAAAVETGRQIVWTVTGSGNGALTYEYEVYQDGEALTGAEITPSANTCAFTPSESGTYQLRATLTDAEGETDEKTGGAVTVIGFELLGALEEVKLGGDASGDYASFGPDAPLSAGIRLEYRLTRVSGTAATLEIKSGTAGSGCAITYQETGLGSVEYTLGYTAYSGSKQLFTGSRTLRLLVAEEDDLPTEIQATPDEVTGAAGQDISLSGLSVSLTGGALLPKDLHYSLRDGSGGAIGTGLTVRFADPGRYALTLVGAYGSNEWTCPVTVVVSDAATGQPFAIEIEEVWAGLYSGGSSGITYANLRANASLEDGEALTWSLERLGGDEGAGIPLTLGGDEGLETTLEAGQLTGSGTVRYRVTASVSGSYEASREFTVTLLAPPAALSGGITYTGDDDVMRTVDQTLRINWADIAAAGGDMPGGVAFSAEASGSAGATVNADQEGATVSFDQAGECTVELIARLGNLFWTDSISVTVEPAPEALALSGKQYIDTLYMDQGASGYLARVWYDPAMLRSNETASWSVQRVDDGEGAVSVTLDREADNQVSLVYSNLLSAGSATFRVTCSVGGASARSASYDIDLTMPAELPEDLPESIHYAESSLPMELGARYHFDTAGILDQDGNALPSYMKYAFDVPDVLADSAEWDDEGMFLTFDQPGRFTVTAVARAGNKYFFAPIIIQVGGDDATGVITFTSDVKTTVYVDGQEDCYLGAVYASNLTLLEGDEVTWSIERVSGSDAIALELEDYAPGANAVGVFLRGVSPVEGTEQAEFAVRCYVNEHYNGTYTLRMTLEPGLPGDLPFAIAYAGGDQTIPVGGSATFRFSDITGVDAPLPEGTDFEFEGDWGYDFPAYFGQSMRIITFTHPGRYLVRPVAHLGNARWEAEPVMVTVGNGVSEDFDLYYWTRTGVIYADSGVGDGYFGGARVDGVTLREGEEGEWSLIPDESDDSLRPATIYIEWVDGEEIGIHYRDVIGTGTVGYTLRYTAADGLYEKARHFEFEVTEKPENGPDAITYEPASLTLDAGESYTFERADVSFAGGTLDGSVNTWIEFWMSGNVWDHCDVEESGETTTVTFRDPGRYVVTVAGGYGNFEFTQQIPVLVRDTEGVAFGLNRFQRMSVLYLDGHDENSNLGGANPDNFEAVENEAFQWDIERIDDNGGNPVELYIGGSDIYGAGVDYRMGSGTGTVVYRVTLTVGEGDTAYTASADFEVTVEESVPEGFPTGIATPYEDSYPLSVGEPITFDRSTFEFAEGEIPDGAEAWRELWWDAGEWDHAEENWEDDDTVTYRFNAPGRYLLKAVIGIGNNMYSQMIALNVRDDEGNMFSNVDQYQRFSVLYADGPEENFLGYVGLSGVALREGEDWSWEMEQLGEGTSPVTMEAWDQNESFAAVHCFLNGGLGTSTWRLSYTAADGELSGYWDFTVTVLEEHPEDFPTGVSIPYNDEINLDVGGTLTVDCDEIQFAEGDEPVDTEVWRDFWESDWGDRVIREDDGTVRHYTFIEPGRYVLTAAIGIGNYECKKQIAINVRDGEGNLFAGNKVQNVDTLFTDGIEDSMLGYVELSGVELKEEDGYSWNVTQVGEGESPVEMYADQQEPAYANVWCRLTGGTGSATWRVSYSAAGGLLAGSWDFTVTVTDEIPAEYPTGVSFHDEGDFDLLVGQTLELDTNEIQFAEGEEPEDDEVWRDFWEGDWRGRADMEEEDSLHRYTFNEPGRYKITAVIGIGNYICTRDVMINVRDGEGNLFTADQLQRYETLYVGGQEDIVLGSVSLGGIDLMEGEGWNWSIDKVGEEASPVEMYMSHEQPDYVNVWCRLTGSTGTGTYQVSYTAADGALEGSWDFTVTVLPEIPSDFPRGIDSSYDSVYNQTVGDTLEFDVSRFEFAEGEASSGVEVLRELWNGEGNWGGVENEVEGNIHRYKFNQPGRYILYARVSIGNYFADAPIEIIVRDGEGSIAMDVWTVQRVYAMYGDGETRVILGDVGVGNVYLRGDEVAHWDMEYTGEGTAPVLMEAEADSHEHARILCTLTGGTGPATYHLHYSAANGLYQTDWYFTVEVFETMPEEYPTGISIPYESAIPLTAGDTLDLDTAEIRFETGDDPADANVWREFWQGDGNWDSVEFGGEGTVQSYTFHEPGEFVIHAMLGIGNHIYTRDIAITVNAE